MTPDCPTYFCYVTPVGHVTIASDGQAITELAFGARRLEGAEKPTELTNRAANQIQEYFAGKRTAFDLPLAPRGTAFQQRVWEALRAIPYGCLLYTSLFCHQRFNAETYMELIKMSKVCEICGKAPVAGRNVSHSHRVTNRTFRPNVQKVTVKIDGKVKRANVCTKCMKAGKIERA